MYNGAENSSNVLQFNILIKFLVFLMTDLGQNIFQQEL